MTTPSAIPEGERVAVATIRIAALRNQYTENGGVLNARRKRFLRRWVRPYISDATLASALQSGGPLTTAERALIPDTRLCIQIPLSLLAARAPQQIRDRLRSVFTALTPGTPEELAWFEARSWLGDPAHRIPEDLLDNELGTVLGRADENDWDSEPPQPEPI